MHQVNRARSMLIWSSLDNDAAVTQPSHLIRLSAALLLFLWTTPCVCQQQTPNILCREGDGVFDAEFGNGVTVHVGATRDPGPTTLAIRACSAKLNWDEQELFVAKGASQLDLDAFGIDMGDGIPVAAFQIKKA